MLTILIKSILRRLWEYNHQEQVWKISIDNAATRKAHSADPDYWGGGTTRRLLHLAYSLSFICLLRSDEVLKIKMEHIKLICESGKVYLVLNLPFRKTAQYGGMVSCDPIAK